ncbi:MAG: DUF4395 domain-containing protein [Edaphocola sp.]
MGERAASRLYVDGQVVRVVAGLAAALTVLTIWTHWTFPVFFLAADFAVRAFTQDTSPLAGLAKELARIMKLRPKRVFAPPKRFAAALGFVFAAATLLLLIFNNPVADYVACVLLVCAVLESVFGLCLGCYVYNWLVLPIVAAIDKLQGGRGKQQGS